MAPQVVPSTQNPDFRLSDLWSQRVAVFPIATVEFDESASETTSAENKGRNALLDTQNPNNRFAEAAPSGGMAPLGRIEGLKGVRYALVARDLSIGRQWTTTSTGGGFVSAGPGGGTFVGGGSSSSAKTSARLRLAILDLEAKTVVWDGAIYAGASSTFMKATALHEVEEDLTVHFVNSILGIK